MKPYGPKIALGAIVLALGALLWVANSATTGSEAASQSLPEEVDRLIPVSGGNILRQETVGIDVAEGYTASLVINDVPIANPIEFSEGGVDDPGGAALVRDGLVYNRETGVITYTPREDGLIERFETGSNCVVANVWADDADPTSGRTVNWCFSAA